MNDTEHIDTDDLEAQLDQLEERLADLQRGPLARLVHRLR